jgi:tripartite-type tricarboxylate transporter receptor subunit TctC
MNTPTIPAFRMALAAGLVGLACTAHAQGNWPSKPITFVIPGAAGGTTDVPARIVGQKLSVMLGQPVVVENKPGAGGILGAQQVLKAPADGHTVLVGHTGSNAIAYSAYKKLTYKPEDFTALTDMSWFPNVLVVPASSPYKSVKDLIADMKARPGKVSYASAGIGQTTHLTGELFKMRVGADALHVPYKGSTPATLAVVAGEVNFMFDNLVQALPQIKGGKERPLAVTGPKRDASLPQVPTMAEAGVADTVVVGWLGFFVPSKVPADVSKKLADALIKVMQDPEVQKQISGLGSTPGGRGRPQSQPVGDAAGGPSASGGGDILPP